MPARQPADRLWIQSVYRDYLDDLAPAHRDFSRAWARSATASLTRSRAGLPIPTPIRWSSCAAASRSALRCVARARRARRQPRIDYRMAEFFIARARRRLGIGQTAVQLILSRFAGRWEINEYLRNAGAVSFWRRVVAAYTRGDYQERIVNGEVHQVFVSGKPRSRRAAAAAAAAGAAAPWARCRRRCEPRVRGDPGHSPADRAPQTRAAPTAAARCCRSRRRTTRARPDHALQREAHATLPPPKASATR